MKESSCCLIDTRVRFLWNNRQVAYLHSRSILHGDVKLPNAVLDAEHKHVKVIDFGDSQELHGSAVATSRCGEYLSPSFQGESSAPDLLF